MNNLTRVKLPGSSTNDQDAGATHDGMQQLQQLPSLQWPIDQTCMDDGLPKLRRFRRSCASCSFSTVSVALVLANSIRCASNRARCSARVLSSAASATTRAVGICSNTPRLDNASCCRLRLLPAGERPYCALPTETILLAKLFRGVGYTTCGKRQQARS